MIYYYYLVTTSANKKDQVSKTSATTEYLEIPKINIPLKTYEDGKEIISTREEEAIIARKLALELGERCLNGAIKRDQDMRKNNYFTQTYRFRTWLRGIHATTKKKPDVQCEISCCQLAL